MIKKMMIWFFLFSLLTVSVISSPQIATFSADRNVVRPGQSISLTCTIFQLNLITTQHFNKEYGLNNTVRLTSGDAEDSIVEPDLRYVLGITPSAVTETTVTYNLLINNATIYDAGNFSCTLVVNKSVIAANYLEIFVHNEPDDVSLYIDNNEILNNSMTMTPLQLMSAHHLKCVATGSNPGAIMKITYSNNIEIHPYNVTISNATYRFDLQQNKFLVPVERNTTVEVNHWLIDTSVFGNDVICSARVSNDRDFIKTMFRPIIADAAPAFNCSDFFKASNGQQNVAITCQVFSHPSLIDAFVYFMIPGQTRITIPGKPFNNSQSSPDQIYKLNVQIIDGIRTDMTLTIATVDLKINKFDFTTINGLGQTVHSVTVTDHTPTLGVSSLSPGYLLSVFLVAAVTHFITRDDQ